MPRLTASFSRFNHRGEACGQSGEKRVTAFGVIPGETAEVSSCRRRGGTAVCFPEKILSPSPVRIPPREAHYLSCSPWQMMSYDFQLRSKEELLERMFLEFSGEKIRPSHFFPSPEKWGYRTKMEFSFAVEDRKLMLAFNERGSPFRKIPLPEGCSLAGAGSNSLALRLVDVFNRLNLSGGELKTLTVRESKSTGKILAGLAVKDPGFRPGEIIENLPPVSGFRIFYSDPKSPSSVVSKILASKGDDFIEEKVAGMELSYGIDGFFQNNIPQFEKALSVISENTPPAVKITELYSGAGAIGILLSGRAAEITGIEMSPAGIEYAGINARKNCAENFTALEAPAEKTPPKILRSADVLILDPPRSGAAPKLLASIREALPPLVVYLSCNPAAQAADYNRLKDLYRLSGLYGFDFHPQTPHIESLLFLKKR